MDLETDWLECAADLTLIQTLKQSAFTSEQMCATGLPPPQAVGRSS
jgi:hypothetical protein